MSLGRGGWADSPRPVLMFLQPKHTCSALSHLGKDFLSLVALKIENGATSTGQPSLHPAVTRGPGASRTTPGCPPALPTTVGAVGLRAPQWSSAPASRPPAHAGLKLPQACTVGRGGGDSEALASPRPASGHTGCAAAPCRTLGAGPNYRHAGRVCPSTPLRWQALCSLLRDARTP